tara:strand:- start:154 stop:414 length:261 start_codon:yes stop_codon:yes gene_type:complete
MCLLGTSYFINNQLVIKMEKRVFTEIETAEYIGMSRLYLRQSRMEGNRANRTSAPPFIKIGRSIRYLKEYLDEWLDQQPKHQHNNR